MKVRIGMAAVSVPITAIQNAAVDTAGQRMRPASRCTTA